MKSFGARHYPTPGPAQDTHPPGPLSVSALRGHKDASLPVHGLRLALVDRRSLPREAIIPQKPSREAAVFFTRGSVPRCKVLGIVPLAVWTISWTFLYGVNGASSGLRHLSSSLQLKKQWQRSSQALTNCHQSHALRPSAQGDHELPSSLERTVVLREYYLL